MIESIYERSRHGDDVNYKQPLDSPLTAEQTAWLQQQLQGRKDGGTSPPRRRPRRGNH